MEELRKQQELIREQMQKEYEEKLKALQKQQGDDQEQKKKLEEEMKKKEEERKRKLEEEEQKIIRKQQEQSDLERRLGVILPMVNEANLISKELKRDVKFNVKLIKTLPETNADGTTELPRTDIVIKIDNFEEGYYYQWPENKFNDRVFMMRDLIEEYFETEKIPVLQKEQDPFWDPPEPQLIGQSFMTLKNLGYLVENEIEAKILSSEGSSGVRGHLSVKYFPTDETGEGEPEEDLLPEEPEDLLGKAIAFRVEIEKAKDLPKDLCKNVFVSYNLHFDRNRTYQTDECNQRTQNPMFNFKRVHHIDAVTPSILRYLANG